MWQWRRVFGGWRWLRHAEMERRREARHPTRHEGIKMGRGKTNDGTALHGTRQMGRGISEIRPNEKHPMLPNCRVVDLLAHESELLAAKRPTLTGLVPIYSLG